MPKPRFSVVIPTRERAKYLDYAIRSCLAQSFGDLEIIVADNCSSASTRETVERHPDQRIRYLRSDQSLAMSANWERGLQAATGEYVTVLGDDDALLLHALADADSLLRSTHSEALRWTCAHYRWPDVAPELAPNLFLIPTQLGSVWTSSPALIRDVANGIRHYNELPTLYNSFVHRDVISSIRARTGKILASMTPDVYSGFAIAATVNRFISVRRPLSIAGISARSNGEAMMRQSKQSTVAQDFESLNSQGGYVWHTRAPNVLRSLPAIIVECFEQASDRFERLKSVKIDRKRLIGRIVAERRQSSSADPEALEDALRGIRTWVKNDPPLSRWFEAHRDRLLRTASAPSETFTIPTKGLHDGWLVLEASQFGAQDSVGAAEFFDKLTHATENLTAPPLEPGWRDTAREVLPPFARRAIRAIVPAHR
jgi:hypothetical protein